MKKSYIYVLLCIAAVFTACDPIEDRQPMGGALTAEDLNISVTPVVRDGVNSNYIELNSEGNACLSSWDYGFGTLVGTKGTVKVMTTGPNEIVYTGLNADGSKITKTVTVNVDKLYDVEPEWALFCGDGEKAWVWGDNEKVYGNGSYLGDKAPGWWGVSADGMEDQAPGEGQKASMVFSVKGAILKKVKSDGSTVQGTFSFDMTKKAEGWSIGKLQTKGVEVLHGIIINDNTPCYEYDILTLDQNNLILSAPRAGVNSQGGEACFWVFKAQ